MQLAGRVSVDKGEDHWHDQQKNREISSGELRRGATCDPIRVSISTTRHLVYRGFFWGCGEDDPRNLFVSSFLRKETILLTHLSRSKYNPGQ